MTARKPTHDIDCVGLRMFAGDRNAAGKTQNEYGCGEHFNANDEHRREGDVVLEADVKS
jgi:hypothetical protein